MPVVTAVGGLAVVGRTSGMTTSLGSRVVAGAGGNAGGTISKPLLMWFLKSPIELWSNLQRASTLFTKGFDTENVSPGGSASNSSATAWPTDFLCASDLRLKGTSGKVSIVVLARFAGRDALSEELPELRPRPLPRPRPRPRSLSRPRPRPRPRPIIGL